MDREKGAELKVVESGSVPEGFRRTMAKDGNMRGNHQPQVPKFTRLETLG